MTDSKLENLMFFTLNLHIDLGYPPLSETVRKATGILKNAKKFREAGPNIGPTHGLLILRMDKILDDETLGVDEDLYIVKKNLETELDESKFEIPII